MDSLQSSCFCSDDPILDIVPIVVYIVQYSVLLGWTNMICINTQQIFEVSFYKELQDLGVLKMYSKLTRKR